MLISFCIPCMNRTADLARALPHMIAAANASPPVEIAVLDYNSTDGALPELMAAVYELADFGDGTTLSYRRYEGRDHYHMAHAWNLAVKASQGEYITIMGADAVPAEGFVIATRIMIEAGCAWMRGPHFKGIMTIERGEFMAAGGFDERFEFYGGEDKDLELRLLRRGGKFGLVPDGLVKVLRTSNTTKIRHFRGNLTKRQMMKRGARIRAENKANGVLVANQGQEWGAWA